MGSPLFITSESGRLLAFDTETAQLDTLYQDIEHESLFGIACEEDQMYLCGATSLTSGRLTTHGFELQRREVPFQPLLRGEARRLVRWIWSRLGFHARAIRYERPGLHQMNFYGDRLYVAASSWNEIWVVDPSLRILERIPLHPHRLDFYHLNNVFCDGRSFYVCLNRYDGRSGIGGYARFDLEWTEILRQPIGCETHALSVIDGNIVTLCCVSWRSDSAPQALRQAGLMVDGALVFEYDHDQYFCKDFSMNTDRIYIVGGTATDRSKRAFADGVLFVLDRSYRLLTKHVFSEFGGFNGCRFQGIDYSKGIAPAEQGLAGLTSPT